ncbi:hypothetical protein DXG01_005800 [Tephrocybe rancida]|nr:hypothetical protein DXG01_005800 [Tephrocybe rancida]
MDCRILYSRGEPLEKCLKMTMPWLHWPNFAFKPKLCLIEWPSTAHPPDGKRYKYKDASNGLEQLQINASNQRCDEDYLDKHAIQIVSWDKEDIEREIDDDDLREVPLVTNSFGCRMISANDSEAYMDALAEFNGLTIVKAKKKAPPKAKHNNTILPRNLHDYPADPNHAKSSNAKADRDKWRASAGNNDCPSKRHHAASIHNDDDHDDKEDDDKVAEQLRRLLKPKKKVSNRKLLTVARDLL